MTAFVFDEYDPSLIIHYEGDLPSPDLVKEYAYGYTNLDSHNWWQAVPSGVSRKLQWTYIDPQGYIPKHMRTAVLLLT